MSLADTSFSLAIKSFRDMTEKKASMIIRKIALDLLKKIVMRTPVDTGRARGSWMMGLNAIPRGEGTIDKSGTTAPLKGMSATASTKVGDTIYIVSNLDYMPTLEYGGFPTSSKGVKTSGGFSTQAPKGMVRVSIAEFEGVVQKALNSPGKE